MCSISIFCCISFSSTLSRNVGVTTRGPISFANTTCVLYCRSTRHTRTIGSKIIVYQNFCKMYRCKFRSLRFQRWGNWDRSTPQRCYPVRILSRLHWATRPFQKSRLWKRRPPREDRPSSWYHESFHLARCYPWNDNLSFWKCPPKYQYAMKLRHLTNSTFHNHKLPIKVSLK